MHQRLHFLPSQRQRRRLRRKSLAGKRELHRSGRNKPTINYLPSTINRNYLLRLWRTDIKGDTLSKNLTTEQLLAQCNTTNGKLCATLLQRYGWEIRDDYPW
jgi:hypothetical protein